jgi:hypothetical protein
VNRELILDYTCSQPITTGMRCMKVFCASFLTSLASRGIRIIRAIQMVVKAKSGHGLKFQLMNLHWTERLCTAWSSGLSVPSPLVGECQDGGEGRGAPPPHRGEKR